MTSHARLGQHPRRGAGLVVLAVFAFGLPGAAACLDDTASIQVAIDNAAANGGGTIIPPRGVYRVKNIAIKDGVNLVGSGPKLTVFRAAGATDAVITVKGGLICDLAVYGTPTEETSGNRWVVGSGGVGRGSSAVAMHG